MKVLNRYVSQDGVYIGRPSLWGNPFVVGRDGTREQVVEKYEQWLINKRPDLVAAAKRELKGKNLVCYCAPQACHGDVLMRIANEDKPKEPIMKEVKLIIAGGRDFNDYELVKKSVFEILHADPSESHYSIVSGMARGADAMGVQFAQEHNTVLHAFPANWDLYGKRAGFMRNEDMGRFADKLLAFWDGKSRGTKHMIEFMYSLDKPVTVVQYSVSPAPIPTVTLTKSVGWARRGGYECSSKGDRRFSAFAAVMPDGRTIEQHYQCDVKGYDPGGTNWRLGKGKPPLDKSVGTWPAYLDLWRTWALDHPEEMNFLARKAIEFDYTLSDMFATTDVNQARALAHVLNELN